MQPANNTLATLDILLEYIQHRGIPVGTLELQRLKDTFATAPNLSRTELQNLLCALLAKDEHQRHEIQQIFNRHVPFDEEDTPPEENNNNENTAPAPITLQATAEEKKQQQQPHKKPAKKRRFNAWYTGIGLLLLIAVTVVTLQNKEKERQNKIGEVHIPPPPKPIAAKKANITKKQQQALKLEQNITLWTPHIDAVEPIPMLSRLLPALLLLLGSGLGFSWLLQKALKQTRRRPAEPTYIQQEGSAWQPPLEKQSDYHLLSSNQRREMSWGISHYLSDQPLTQLDIPRSVAASAKTAMPSLHFMSARQEREVWLWQDRSSSNPDLNKLAQEITQTLQAVNIYIQQGYFHALPNTIVNQHQETIWSSQHEYPENQPLVVILSDYASLSRSHALHSEEGEKTFKQLSHWENLCMVDCSAQNSQLCQHISRYSLECILPDEVPRWLASQGRNATEKAPSECKLDDLDRWAIACALPDRPLMEAEIRTLHEALQLDCNWQYHQLTRFARKFGKGYDFSPTRHQLLQQFAHLHDTAKQNPLDQHFIQRSLQFWQQRYEEIDTLSTQQEQPDRLWVNTDRQHQLMLNIALLQLWQKEQIKTAAQTLYNLYQDKSNLSLKKEVAYKLGQYTFKGWQQTHADQAHITLPHQWHDLDLPTQQQLISAGLGGTAHPVGISWNKSTGILLGVLAGLTLASLIASYQAIKPIIFPQLAEIVVAPNSPLPPLSERITNQDHKKLTIGHRKTARFETVKAPDNYQVHLHWQQQPMQAAQAQLDKQGKLELWRLGERKQPIMHPEAKRAEFSIAVIEASPKDNEARKLAAKLLDSGTVDQVLMGKHWKLQQKKISQQIGQAGNRLDSQWLYINTDKADATEGQRTAWFGLNPAELNSKLVEAKAYSAEELGGVVLPKSKPVIVYGIKKKEGDRLDIKLAQGMVLKPIPKGSFQMGSEKYDSEKPVHTVTITDDFYMSATEVTFDQYVAYTKAADKENPDDEKWGKGNRPVINVSWDDAQAYVKWLSSNNEQGLACRLPSEAEWEYAARAGTTTVYPWGDEASHENANYGKDECCGGLKKGRDQWENTAPVGSFPANNFGLSDMHGNVYEWVQDCYVNSYAKTPRDGSAQEADQCGSRVLRGGSWYYLPVNLRSANRGLDRPDVRDSHVGFRVVCVPPLTDH